jgi:general secretion pathway protein K
MLPAQVQSFWQLVCDPRWDPLFDREDATGMRWSRADVLVQLRDWVDDDAVSSALATAFSPNGCALALPQNPFEPGFGDENAPYDRGEDRYRAKNARMDSLDELYLVAGVSDAFMAAFGDQLTVYLPRDEKQNVNTMNTAAMLRLAMQMASPPDQAKLADPAFLVALAKTVVERTFAGVLTLSPRDFGDIVQGLGVTVDQNRLTGPNSPFTDHSTVYRLRSTARAGDVTKTLDVVLRADKIQPNVPMPGTIRHWREE